MTRPTPLRRLPLLYPVWFPPPRASHVMLLVLMSVVWWYSVTASAIMRRLEAVNYLLAGIFFLGDRPGCE